MFKKKLIQKRDVYVGAGTKIRIGLFSLLESVRIGWQSDELFIRGGKFEIFTFIIQKRTLNPLIHFQVQQKWKAHNQPMILEPPYVPIALRIM
jgi:hypothetical protein